MPMRMIMQTDMVMRMAVHQLAMAMGVRVDEVDGEQQVFVVQDLVCRGIGDQAVSFVRAPARGRRGGGSAPGRGSR